ncbi:MAG: N-acetyltransferase [bacterium]
MIRRARIKDAPIIKAIINKFAARGDLLPVSLQDIYEHLRDFIVYLDDSIICGVCALHITWKNIAEIRSLAVIEKYQKTQIGRQLVETCLNEAIQLGIGKVFCLTYKKDFFLRLGFKIIDKSKLPHKIWSDCYKCPKFPNCKEIAMITYLEKKT